MYKLVLKITCFRKEWAKYSANQTAANTELVHICFCGTGVLIKWQNFEVITKLAMLHYILILREMSGLQNKLNTYFFNCLNIT